MTNKQALAAKVACPVPDETLEVALIDNEVNGATTYSFAEKENIEWATISVLKTIVTQPDIVEGGYSLSHPDWLAKVKERLSQLATDLGDTDTLAMLDETPTVKGKTVW